MSGSAGGGELHWWQQPQRGQLHWQQPLEVEEQLQQQSRQEGDWQEPQEEGSTWMEEGDDQQRSKRGGNSVLYLERKLLIFMARPSYLLLILIFGDILGEALSHSLPHNGMAQYLGQ